MYLFAKFDRPKFTRSEVIVRTNILTNTHTDKLDSMRWFSHRRSLSPRAATHWYRLLLLAAYRLRRTPYYALSCGWLNSFSFFDPGDLDLWPLTLTYEFWQDLCTVHLTAKFHHPTFSRLEAIVRTNTLTNRRRWKHPSRSATLRRWVTKTNRPRTNPPTDEEKSTAP